MKKSELVDRIDAVALESGRSRTRSRITPGTGERKRSFSVKRAFRPPRCGKSRKTFATRCCSSKTAPNLSTRLWRNSVRLSTS